MTRGLALIALMSVVPIGTPQVEGAGAPVVVQQRPDTTGYGCIVCHAEKRRLFTMGAHAERGIQCHSCHGGDPAALTQTTAHSRGFAGAPGKVAAVRLCASCHSDPDQMRQFGLPADQLAEFRTSRHGQLLLSQSNLDAPTCSDCHDAHLILPPEDARSRVHPANIPETCARCHADNRIMSKYGLPTDQLTRFREGAHGVALFETSNYAAPTCVGCHGSHAALPPAVRQVSHVCDRCHAVLRREFYDGPHGAPALDGRIPGCLACHSNHGTERVAPSRITEVCGTCHEAQSGAAAVGVTLQQRLVRATEDLRLAEEAIEALVRMGRRPTDARLRYEEAFTDYQRIAAVQHSLDLDALEDLALRVSSVSRDIRATAEAGAERQWEHRLILLPVWFLALAAVVLSWFKLRDLRRRAE